MRKFLNALAWLAIVLFVLFDIVLVMGTRLPRQHSVVRTVTIHQPAQRIWAALTDFAQQPKWRPDLVSVERMPKRGGQEVWRENYKNGMSDTLITEQWVPPVYLVRTIADEKSPVQGSWEFTLQRATEGSTKVTINERALVPNPLYRFMGNYVLRYSYIDNFLKQLAAKMGEPTAKVS